MEAILASGPERGQLVVGNVVDQPVDTIANLHANCLARRLPSTPVGRCPGWDDHAHSGRQHTSPRREAGAIRMPDRDGSRTVPTSALDLGYAESGTEPVVKITENLDRQCTSGSCP
jgi:hypothetical protein